MKYKLLRVKYKIHIINRDVKTCKLKMIPSANIEFQKLSLWIAGVFNNSNKVLQQVFFSIYFYLF